MLPNVTKFEEEKIHKNIQRPVRSVNPLHYPCQIAIELVAAVKFFWTATGVLISD